MRVVRLVAALGLLLVTLVLVPSTAFACSCARMSTAQQVDNAEVVVRGTIDSRELPPAAGVGSSGDPVTYAVTVAETYKGPASGTLEVRSVVSGASCGLENIRLGEEYVVFAYTSDQNRDPDQLWANLCGGTRPATPAFVSEVEESVGSTPETPAPSVVPSEVPAGQASVGASVPAPDPGGTSEPWWPWAAGATLLGLAAAVVVRRLRNR